MKKGSRVCFCLLVVSFLVLSLMVLAESAGAKENITIVREPSHLKWSQVAQTVVLPSRDMNADGKKEKIRLSVLMGGSANLDTIKVYDVGGKLIFKADYSSDGGCAIGNILGGPKQQIAFWRMVWGKNESHPAAHFWEVTIYDWNRSGRLAEASFYRTKKKYRAGNDAWREYLRNHASLPAVTSLKVVRVSAKDFTAIHLLGLKKTPDRTHISSRSVRQVGDWVILFRSQPAPETWNGQWEIWLKKGATWKHKVTFGETDGEPEIPPENMGIPAPIWQKLWQGHNKD